MTDAVSPERRADALARLARIEADHGVRVLYACESGSRAWGFASADSDYDVRFVYAHPTAHYLSVERARDVIETPLDDAMDVAGWDLPKALGLLRTGNPPLLEWLGSPVVYRADEPFADGMRILAAAHFSPRASAYHYLSMARSNHRAYLTGEAVQTKKYLYVLRPLLAVRWIEAGRGPVPTPFADLVEAGLDEPAALAALGALLVRKQGGLEKDREPHTPALLRWIEAELGRLASGPAVHAPPVPPAAPFDAFLHATLRRVYGPTF